jgi:hypothetical protein
MELLKTIRQESQYLLKRRLLHGGSVLEGKIVSLVIQSTGRGGLYHNVSFQ